MRGERTIAASDFFEGIMSTALAEDELLAEVRLPLLAADTKFGFNEFSRRAGDFAMAAALVTYRLQDGKIADARVGIGGAEARPRRIAEAEAALNGQKPGDDVLPRRGRSRRQSHRAAGRSPDQCRLSARSGARRRAPRAGALASHDRAIPKARGTTWVGRAIRRLEDPALVTGQGRFTADLPATHWVRFVRSPVAAGKIEKIAAPDGATVITAADLKALKPITPMLHKFNYRPVGQPMLADGVVRFVGEPIAAVIAATKEEAEDIAERSRIDRSNPRMPLIDARGALAAGAPQLHAEAPGNVIVEGRFKSPGFDDVWNGAARL